MCIGIAARPIVTARGGRLEAANPVFGRPANARLAFGKTGAILSKYAIKTLFYV
jgi:hypothetical protein